MQYSRPMSPALTQAMYGSGYASSPREMAARSMSVSGYPSPRPMSSARSMSSPRPMSAGSMSPRTSSGAFSPRSPAYSDRLSRVGGTRSTLGPQAYRRQSPSYGFGTSNRSHVSRMYVSAELAAKSMSTETPGPGAYSHSVSPLIRGRQSISSHTSPPSFGFGTAARFKEKRDSTPGPGSYVI